jgi:hypothetical protein
MRGAGRPCQSAGGPSPAVYRGWLWRFGRGGDAGLYSGFSTHQPPTPLMVARHWASVLKPQFVAPTVRSL